MTAMRELARGLARGLGTMLRPIRPGVDALTGTRVARHVRHTLEVTSPVFREGDAIPRAFTADGDGRFPGIAWQGLPEATRSVVLLVEDADIPLPYPVTHLIVHSIPPAMAALPAGAVSAYMANPAAEGWAVGRNFMGAAGWTPPAPPPGHGGHRYAFQVFALDAAPSFPHPPSRRGLMRRIRTHIVGQGRVIGTYKRV